MTKAAGSAEGQVNAGRRRILRRGAQGLASLTVLELLASAGLMRPAQGQDVPRLRGDPQKIFEQALEDALEAGEVGLQIAVYKDGGPVVDVWGGVADQKTGRKVDRDTLFNVFSVTKAWTNVALQIQAERGLIDYNRPVAHYWPEFGNNGKEVCTVRDALSHRAGIPLMPEGVTPQQMADYEWMVRQIAAMKPTYKPGTANGYHSYTWGWLISEIVRRTDSKRRPFGQFIQDEICSPLGISNMWMGTPEAARPRIATMYGKGASAGRDEGSLFVKSMPLKVETSPEVWGLPVVQKACIPGAGGITAASSHVKLWAMLASGGELNGARLLSPERIRGCSLPRIGGDTPDVVLGNPLSISSLGFWLKGSGPIVGSSEHIIGQTGAGNSIGWADPDNRLAVVIGHNRFGSAYSQPLKRAVTSAFGVS